MKKVYVVTSGCYSGKSTDGIFTTRQKAEEFIRMVKGDWNDIWECEVDPPTAMLIREGYWPWTVHMLRNGNVESVGRLDECGRYETQESVSLWQRTQVPAYKGKGIPDCLIVSVMARSEKHAVKIANEKRSQFIAEGKWEVESKQKGGK